MAVTVSFTVYGQKLSKLEALAETELARFAEGHQQVEYDMRVEARMGSNTPFEVILWEGNVEARIL